MVTTGKFYWHPYRPGTYIIVADPDPNVNRPPAIGEGEVYAIELDHVHTSATDLEFRRCQMCPKSVPYAEPHIMAVIYLECEGPLGNRFTRAYFCSRECLGRWASRDGVKHSDN